VTIENTISWSQQRLRRVDQALDRARDLLQTARRSVHWWRIYYLTRAQYHFEYLMLLITAGPRGAASAIKTRPAFDEGDPNWLHLQVLEQLRLGLRSVQNGLDCLSPDRESETETLHDPDESSRDRREERLVQLWYQFLIVKLAHEAIRLSPATLDIAEFWECWAHLVDMEHAWVVPNQAAPKKELREYVCTFLDGANGELKHIQRYGLPARAFVERWLYRGFSQNSPKPDSESILDVTFRLRNRTRRRRSKGVTNTGTRA
jgi:hypothetical protein